MLRFLKQFNYSPPNIEEFDNGIISVQRYNNTFTLFCNGERWLVHNILTQNSAFEVYSHYHLAKGHCICTGLGFGIRESWLLNKPEVTKLTVIERSKELIEYHRQIKSPFLDHIEIIEYDATEYKGKCDTLLLDHYEFEHLNEEKFLDDVRNVVNNIECDTLWFWPLEKLLLMNGIWNHSFCKDRYEWYRRKTKLDKLPDLESEDIMSFCLGFVAGNLVESTIANVPQDPIQSIYY